MIILGEFMKEMSLKAASRWETQRKNKYLYIFKRALLVGSITSCISLPLMFAISGANEYRDIYSIIIFCIGSFIIWSTTFGLLSALGDWKTNEKKYESYMKGID